MIEQPNYQTLLNIFSKGQTEYAKGNFQTAIFYYKCAISYDPSASFTYHYLATVQFSNGLKTSSLYNYYKAYNLRREDMQSLFNIVYIEFGNRRYLECAEACKRYLEDFSASAGADPDGVSFTYAICLYSLNQGAEAEALLLRLKHIANQGGAVEQEKRINYFLARIAFDRCDYVAAINHAQASFDCPEERACRQIINFAAFRSGQDIFAYAINSLWAASKFQEAQSAFVGNDIDNAREAIASALSAAPWSAAVTALAQTIASEAFSLAIENKSSPAVANSYWRDMEIIRQQGNYSKLIFNNEILPITDKRRVFDCFIFNDELDLVDYRFEELYDYVDYFVIVESPWTFRGDPKPLHFRQNADRYKRFADKIIYVNAEYFCHGLAWDQETYQRNMIMAGLGNCRDDDMILITDVDEIPRAQVVADIRQATRRNDEIQALSFRYYQLFINAQIPIMWERQIVAPYGLIKQIGPSVVRSLTIRIGVSAFPLIYDSGWHFSSVGGVEAYLKKFRENSHVELTANEETRLNVAEAFTAGRFKGELERLRLVQIDDSFPRFVQTRQQRLIENKWVYG